MDFENQRKQMVREMVGKYGLKNQKVLDVILRVPRYKFIIKNLRHLAYKDAPVDIGFGQTISQPFTVAFMTQLVTSDKRKVTREEEPKTKDQRPSKVLEIGTGSGYQAAVLSHFFDEVYTTEIIPELAMRASTILKRLGYKNVFVKSGSGEWGWKVHSPFDAIIVTAGMEKVPQELFDRLKTGGILVASVGEGKEKTMTRFAKKSEGKFKSEEFGTFSFVPFVGKND